MTEIDLRSDTVSTPSPEMIEEMARAKVGDDVYDEDPSINALQEQMAQQLKREASLFFPSATMANLVAAMTHSKAGDEIIIPSNSHASKKEFGFGPIAGLFTKNVVTPDGIFTFEDIRRKIRKRKDHVTFPDTSLIIFENPTSAGAVWPLSQLQDLYQKAKESNTKVHVDGCRLFNILSEQIYSPTDFSSCFDSLTVSLSKGLCCPIGALLVGDAEFIDRAKQVRKSIGGGMRQMGLVCAAGAYALKHIYPKLREDNANCRVLVKGLEQLGLKTRYGGINICFFQLRNSESLLKHMAGNKILLRSVEPDDEYRLVTHRTVTLANCNKFLAVLALYIKAKSETFE